MPGVNLGGVWEQRFPWSDAYPKQLQVDIESEQLDPTEQRIKLESYAVHFFGSRQCLGFVASLRKKCMPLAGSMFWSVLLRGMLILSLISSV
jgi:hypothetical protein